MRKLKRKIEREAALAIQQSQPLPEYLDYPQAARRLDVTERTLRNWKDRRLIPFYRIGHSIRFRVGEIDEHLKRNCRVAPRGE